MPYDEELQKDEHDSDNGDPVRAHAGGERDPESNVKELNYEGQKVDEKDWEIDDRISNISGRESEVRGDTSGIRVLTVLKSAWGRFREIWRRDRLESSQDRTAYRVSVKVEEENEENIE